MTNEEQQVTRGDETGSAESRATAAGSGTTHTFLPWVVTSNEGPDSRGVEKYSVCADNSPSGMSMDGDAFTHQCVATVRGKTDDESLANAVYIVRACNSHYDLLNALKAIAEGCSFPEDDVQRAVRDRARAAVAKVEG